MLNMNSPIVNNMMMGQQMGGYNIPPSPIGNTLSMGMGYNNMGGYYGGNYNYVSPYLIQQQQQAQQARFREQQRQIADSNKALARSAAIANGIEPDEELLSKKYDPVYDQPYTKQEQIQNSLWQAYLNSQMYDPDQLRIQRMNAIYEKEKIRVPDDISLADWMDVVNKELADMERQEMISQQRKGIKNLYNSNEFKQLVSMHGSNGYFGNMYNNNTTSIEDMEVTLPQHLVTPYQEKKRKFLEAIGMRGR